MLASCDGTHFSYISGYWNHKCDRFFLWTSRHSDAEVTCFVNYNKNTLNRLLRIAGVNIVLFWTSCAGWADWSHFMFFKTFLSFSTLHFPFQVNWSFEFDDYACFIFMTHLTLHQLHHGLKSGKVTVNDVSLKQSCSLTVLCHSYERL